MKKIMRSVDRFCILHPRFGVPNLMLYIVIGNAIVFVFSLMDTSGLLTYLLYFNPELIFTKGQVWRLFTFVLMPDGGQIFFVLISLYFYYFIGSTLERQWGCAKFNIYYISGILLSIAYGTCIWLITGYSFPVSARYINLSMFFSFATLYPNMQVLLFFIIPIKVKWLALLDAAFFLWAIITGPFPLNLLPVIAVLNYLLFCGEYLMDYLRPLRAGRSPTTVNFKRAAKRVRKESRNATYRRKCSVCGKTDTDNPDMEFRYCSRCQGYHCFCEKHINNHVHFTE